MVDHIRGYERDERLDDRLANYEYQRQYRRTIIFAYTGGKSFQHFLDHSFL